MEKIIALIEIYEYNLRILHWKTCGARYDANHSLLGDHYEALGNMLDSVSELAMEQGIMPPSISEAIQIASSSEDQVMILSGKEDYSNEETWERVKFMYNHLLTEMNKVYESQPSDIQSELDNHIQYLRLEGVYKARQRSVNK